MKILKHGGLKSRKFICWYCGCEFVADVSEYTTKMVCGEPIWHSAHCPECDMETTNSESWEEQNEINTD